MKTTFFKKNPTSIRRRFDEDSFKNVRLHFSVWNGSKWYFVNVERGNIADKLQLRNIDVSFTNNSNVPIDVIIFTFYSDQLTIDVETGIVTKYFSFLNIVIKT